LAKIDKSQYTKQQWKLIREQRRLEKQQCIRESQSKQHQESNSEIVPTAGSASKYIVCLKHGNKYSSDYVNTLYSMVRRHCSLEYEFVCFTENSHGIDNRIRIEPLLDIPKASGWWYKPMFFSPQLPLNGTVLYLDLDLIIFRNIDNLFHYKPGLFCIIKDFNRSIRKDWRKFNSSVFRFESQTLPAVYENFIKDPQSIMRRFHGDQDWIYDQIKSNFDYWPDEWIQSYKWEMRGRPAMVRTRDGKRNFSAPGDPNILDNTSVAVFHGEPNPHDCVDPWCKQNWR
jgi:hypothetical protein